MNTKEVATKVVAESDCSPQLEAFLGCLPEQCNHNSYKISWAGCLMDYKAFWAKCLSNSTLAISVKQRYTAAL